MTIIFFTHFTVFVRQPGFTTAALLSYEGLEESLNHYFNHIETQKGETFKINSKVVTATVSNTETDKLQKPVNFTFSHLEVRNSLLAMYRIQCITPM